MLPTTACTPALIASMTLAGAASGVVKSTITSAPSRRSETELSSAGSARPTSSMSSAPSTASQTVSPMRPAAPETTTLIASAMVGDVMRRAAAGYSRPMSEANVEVVSGHTTLERPWRRRESGSAAGARFA